MLPLPAQTVRFVNGAGSISGASHTSGLGGGESPSVAAAAAKLPVTAIHGSNTRIASAEHNKIDSLRDLQYRQGGGPAQYEFPKCTLWFRSWNPHCEIV
jgi:hypothetical protein